LLTLSIYILINGKITVSYVLVYDLVENKVLYLVPYITSNKAQNVLMVQHFCQVHSIIICVIAIVSIIHKYCQCKLIAITTFFCFNLALQVTFRSSALSPACLSLAGIF